MAKNGRKLHLSLFDKQHITIQVAMDLTSTPRPLLPQRSFRPGARSKPIPWFRRKSRGRLITAVERISHPAAGRGVPSRSRARANAYTHAQGEPSLFRPGVGGAGSRPGRPPRSVATPPLKLHPFDDLVDSCYDTAKSACAGGRPGRLSGRRTGNPVRIRNGPAAVTERKGASSLFGHCCPVTRPRVFRACVCWRRREGRTCWVRKSEDLPAPEGVALRGTGRTASTFHFLTGPARALRLSSRQWSAGRE